MKTIARYVCEVCGGEYETEHAAVACETLSPPRPDWQVGDKAIAIHSRTREETPVEVTDVWAVWDGDRGPLLAHQQDARRHAARLRPLRLRHSGFPVFGRRVEAAVIDEARLAEIRARIGLLAVKERAFGAHDASARLPFSMAADLLAMLDAATQRAAKAERERDEALAEVDAWVSSDAR